MTVQESSSSLTTKEFVVREELFCLVKMPRGAKILSLSIKATDLLGIVAVVDPAAELVERRFLMLREDRPEPSWLPPMPWYFVGKYPFGGTMIHILDAQPLHQHPVVAA